MNLDGVEISQAGAEEEGVPTERRVDDSSLSLACLMGESTVSAVRTFFPQWGFWELQCGMFWSLVYIAFPLLNASVLPFLPKSLIVKPLSSNLIVNALQ